MNFRKSAILIGSTLLLTQCGPEAMLNPTQVVTRQPIIPVGPETSFVNDLRGSMFTFMDSKGENVYRLSKLGTYTYSTLSYRKRPGETGQGLYIYKRTGKKTGQIILDLKETWNLTFASPHRAIARKEGDKRSYTLEFEWQ